MNATTDMNATDANMTMNARTLNATDDEHDANAATNNAM